MKLKIVMAIFLVLISTNMANASTDRIGLLVQNSNNLDPDENNIKQFLTDYSYQYDIIDPTMIKNSLVNIDSYKVLYMRTGSQPINYNDIAVITKIKSNIQNGGKLILEYYGLYLGSYIGVGNINIRSWFPAVRDATYFVKPKNSIDNLFLSINSWSPPTTPDNNLQLITQLTSPGRTYNYPYFRFNLPSQLPEYWFLTATYGWNGQPTNSDYCSQHTGLCTPNRAVHGNEYSFGVGNIEFINYGSGYIYRLGLNIGQAAPANVLIFGPIAGKLRKNAIGKITSSGCKVSTVSGYNYNDANSNKVRDTGEIGNSNWVINLKGYDTCTRALVNLMTTTNSAGYYKFNINSGSYIIYENFILNWLPTTDAAYTIRVPLTSTTIRKDFGNKRQ